MVTVYLGADSSLSVSGVVLTAPVAAATQVYTTGEVLAGGTITLSGQYCGGCRHCGGSRRRRGSGASLYADGTVGTIDVPSASITSSKQVTSLGEQFLRGGDHRHQWWGHFDQW